MKLKLERQELCSAVRHILMCHLIEVLLLLCAPVSSLNKLHTLQYIGCYFFISAAELFWICSGYIKMTKYGKIREVGLYLLEA